MLKCVSEKRRSELARRLQLSREASERGYNPPVSSAYFILVREMAYNHRLRLVAYARQHGIKPAARLFQTTPPTVHKWLRRHQQQEPRGFDRTLPRPS